MSFDWDAFKKEEEAYNRVYWRLYVNREDEPVVVTMQSFDEMDYDQDRFINDEKYDSEEQAKQALLAYKLKASVPLTNLEKFKLIAMLEKE